VQKKLSMIAAITAPLFLFACGEDSATDQTAETPPSQPETPIEPATPDEPEAPAAPVETAQPAADPQAADLKRGARQFLKCRSCHTLAEGEKHKTGPNLWGIFGAQTAARSDFKYSNAFTNLNQTWTDENMDLFLKRPSKFASGTIMSFAGVPKEKDRRDLIAYLKQETTPQ